MEVTTITKTYTYTPEVSIVVPFYNEEDGIPLSLKALLYNRYSHWNSGFPIENEINGFKEFLQDNYLRSR